MSMHSKYLISGHCKIRNSHGQLSIQGIFLYLSNVSQVERKLTSSMIETLPIISKEAKKANDVDC